MLLAVGLSATAAVLTASAPLAGVVTPATPPAFLSWPLLLTISALPAVLAATFLRRGRPAGAVAALAGAAALAPGRFVLDLQLLVDAAMAVRPGLLLPRDLDPLTASTGLWLLLAAHVAVVAAGVLAVSVRGLGYDGDAARGVDRPTVARRRQGLLGAALLTAALGAAGALMAQFGADDPYLLPGAALDSPVLVLAGSVLLALSIAVTAGVAVSSSDPEAARGGLLGLAAALAGVSLTALLGAWLTAQVRPGWGAVLGVVAVGAFVLLALPSGRTGEPRTADDLQLPALKRVVVLAGVPALAAGALSIAGASTPLLHMPPGFREFTPYAARMLVPAGLVMLAAGAALLVPAWSTRVRPALTIAWGAVPLAGAATLDTVLTAAQAAGARVGIGTWAALLAVVLSGLAASAAAVAGAIERDDVDLTELTRNSAAALPAAVAGVLTLGTYGLPVITAPDFEAPGLVTGFDTTSWGLVAAVLAVLAAVSLAPVCRSSRSVALLGGAALVVGVRLLELPLTAGRAAGSGPGPGLWCGLGCLAALAVTAFVTRKHARTQ